MKVYTTTLILFFFFLASAQSESQYLDSLLKRTQKDTSYIKSILPSSIKFSKSKIDSINNIPVQGVAISQDSLRRLLISSIERAKGIGYLEGAAEGYIKLGVNYYYQGNFKANFECQLEAIRIYDRIGDVVSAAKAYGELGYGAKRRDLAMANSLMQRAIRLAKQDSLKAEIKNIYNNYSIIKLMQKKYDSAKFYANRGLAIKKIEKDSFGLPYSYANLANVYVEEGNLEDGLINFKKALDIRKQLNDSIGLGESYTQVGEIFKAKGDFSKAIDNFKRAVYFADKKQYLHLLSYDYQQLSEIYKRTNTVDSSLHYLERHLSIKDKIESEAIKEELAALRVKFDTKIKEKAIATQKAKIAQDKLTLSKRNSQLIGMSILAILLSILGYLIYNQQKLRNEQLLKESQLKEALTKIETQNRLQEQRLSISRDLHDNIGAQLTFIISSIDNLKYGFELPGKLKNKLSSISEFTYDTISELRDTIWAMNKNEISFEDLQIRVSNFIEKANLASKNIQFNFHVSDDVDSNKVFSSVEGMNIYRIIQEAVNNSIKYAEATKISIRVIKENNLVNINVQDNGRGFEISEVILGNGINNMKKRAEEIQASFNLESIDLKGTKVSLTLKS